MTAIDVSAHYSRADHGVQPHQLVILTAHDSQWLAHLARRYQQLRTSRRVAVSAPSAQVDRLSGIETLDVAALQSRLVRTQVPAHSGGNFGIVRSDLAEVLLNVVGAAYGGFEYGYEGLRDRETANQPGRSIDQIGVRADVEAGVMRLMLGEAKASSEQRNPPRVVDYNDDSLSKSHLKQLSERDKTHEKILHAYRFCTDTAVGYNFALAAQMFESEHPQLNVHVTSMLLRSAATVDESDFGSYASAPEQFSPAVVDFYIVAGAEGEFDDVVREFARLALIELNEEENDESTTAEDVDDDAP